MTGVNAGGLFVLEPWITPSLFYRFLGKDKDHTALDSYTLCEALGEQEGNKLMRAHWETWYVEEHIKVLSEKGVELIRLPIGDWTLDPYGPFHGCMEGAAEYITRFMDWCAKYNIKVLMDVHAMKGSQNGYDNSGKASDIIWDGMYNYTHITRGHWWGEYNLKSGKYDSVNWEGYEWGLKVHENLLKYFGKHPALYAFEPINEPQTYPILPLLKEWYRMSRRLVAKYSPDTLFVFHNGGISDNAAVWNDMFDDDDDKIRMDIHVYKAFGPRMMTTDDVCDGYAQNISSNVKDVKYPVWVGEWSLATDVCAMFLLGF